MTLQSIVQSAGARYRAEQDRQTFTRTSAATGALDLHGQLLTPALALPIGDVDAPLGTYFQQAAGLTVPPAVRLADLLDGLITPPAERDMLGAEIIDPYLDEIADPPPFSDATYDVLVNLLDLDPDVPQRLSGLLAAARCAETDDDSGDVSDLPLLVVVRVLALASQEIGAARRAGESHVLMAVDDGAPLKDPEFAGTDLLVARAEIQPNGTSGSTPTGAMPIGQQSHRGDGAAAGARGAARSEGIT